jgi:hypothetical protein
MISRWRSIQVVFNELDIGANASVEFDDGWMEGAIEPFTPGLGLTHIFRTPTEPSSIMALSVTS